MLLALSWITDESYMIKITLLQLIYFVLYHRAFRFHRKKRNKYDAPRFFHFVNMVDLIIVKDIIFGLIVTNEF